MIALYLLNAEISPTPTPAKKRPITKTVGRTRPKQKTTRGMESAILLPAKSAVGAAVRATKSVPTDIIDIIRDGSEAVAPGLPVSGLIQSVEDFKPMWQGKNACYDSGVISL
jgi:hypothetical protein